MKATKRFSARLWPVVLALFLTPLGCGGVTQNEVSYYQNEELRMEERRAVYDPQLYAGDNEFVFNNRQFSARFSVYPDRAYHFGFTLANHTEEPIVIYWNRIRYRDLAGRMHHTLPEGAVYMEPVNKVKPTMVPAQGAIKNLLSPADQKVDEGVLRYVRVGKVARGVMDPLDSLVLVIPMRVLGVDRNYSFSLPLGELEYPILSDPFWF